MWATDCHCHLWRSDGRRLNEVIYGSYLCNVGEGHELSEKWPRDLVQTEVFGSECFLGQVMWSECPVQKMGIESALSTYAMIEAIATFYCSNHSIHGEVWMRHGEVWMPHVCFGCLDSGDDLASCWWAASMPGDSKWTLFGDVRNALWINSWLCANWQINILTRFFFPQSPRTENTWLGVTILKEYQGPENKTCILCLGEVSGGDVQGEWLELWFSRDGCLTKKSWNHVAAARIC